jgi:DNA topoisomerase VI subunit A
MIEDMPRLISNRELYYRDPNLFRSQSNVDRYLEDIARSFGIPRSMLNVVRTWQLITAHHLTCD